MLKMRNSFLSRMGAIILTTVLIMPLLSICTCAEPGEFSGEGEARYTVMLLDISGPQTFKELPSYLNLNGTEYTSDSSIEQVKSAAKQFLSDAEYAIGENYIAIVTYSESAQVVSGFTDDLDKLQRTLDSIEYVEGRRSIFCGLDCAQGLLESITRDNVTKNLLICTTGLTDCGENSYEGWYSKDTIASDWQNKETEIKLYAYANPAIECADKMKNAGIEIYVLGIFEPVEGNLPNSSALRNVASFLRLTAHDLASSEDTFFIVEDPNELEFVFGELQGELTGSELVRIYNNSDGYGSSAHTDENGGKLGLGGYYEEMLWGSSLFEVPATRMHLRSISSSDSENYQLAMVCGSLCIACYDGNYLKQAYLDLGFKEENISFYSYPSHELNQSNALRDGKRFADDNDLAFSMASQRRQVAGEDTDILVIVLSGTHNIWEAINDGISEANKRFYDYIAWNWIYEYKEDVFAGFKDYYSKHSELGLGERPLKILVTGHSLGGAGANLVAAQLNLESGNNAWYSKNVTPDDIYAYTFGAIDAISKDATNADWSLPWVTVPVTKGFENIGNIYNYLDTFGPYSDGVAGFTAAGNKMYDKFGVFYTFENSMSNVVNRESKWPTHELAGYIHAVREGWLSTDSKTDMLRVCIRCPVDVEVYDGDILVCSVVSEKIMMTSPEIAISVENGTKTFLFPKEKDFRIIITAFDEGTMEYSVDDLNMEDQKSISLSEISLENGKRMMSEIAAASEANSVELFVVDKSGDIVSKINNDGTETRIKAETVNLMSPRILKAAVAVILSVVLVTAVILVIPSIAVPIVGVISRGRNKRRQ